MSTTGIDSRCKICGCETYWYGSVRRCVSCENKKESKRLALEAVVRELLENGTISALSPTSDVSVSRGCFDNLRKAYKELSE